MSNLLSPDRSAPPSFKTDFTLPTLDFQTRMLPNGVPVHFVRGGSQDVIKIEFSFLAGTAFSQKPMVAQACNELIREGTVSRSSAGIAEELDFFGAYFETAVSRDFASISLFSTGHFLKKTLPVFFDVICNPVFPESELELFKTNRLQKMQVNQQKVDWLARNEFPELLFGPNHRYNTAVKAEHYQQINQLDLIDFYRTSYRGGLRHVLVAGKISSENESAFLDFLAAEVSTAFSIAPPHSPEPLVNGVGPSSRKVQIPGAIQSAIRIGCPLFNRLHQDSVEFSVLNTLLGGYFGSRLMSNIREDKGYTYGIGSGITMMLKGGIFVISTEVGADVTDDAIREIYFELNRLRTERVSDEELELVKNYMLGNFLRSLDGPFAMASRLSGLLDFGFGVDYLNQLPVRIREVNAEKLVNLASAWLNPDSMYQMVVGPENG